MSQCQQILSHLKKRPITPIEALQNYGCFRLAARVADLRDQGHQIATDIIQDGDKRYASYRLVRGRK